jgi:hypothetical protein
VSPQHDQDNSQPAPQSTVTPGPPGAERREYFRVEDQLILRYRVVPADAPLHSTAERHFDNSEIFELLRELRHIDQEHNNVLRTLAEQNRELGLYLKNMNRKIELVANALASVDQLQQGQKPQLASISESGLAFEAEPRLEVGATLALEMILLPQHTALALYGEVVMNRDQPPARSVVAFQRLRESDRQILARHILQVQIAAKRQHQND